MAPPWDDLRATLAEMGEAFGEAAVKDLESEGCVDAANALRGAIKGEPRGAGGEAAAAAWARLQTGVGWTTPAWRECYVLGQLREATEAAEAASRLPVDSPSATTAAAAASASPAGDAPSTPDDGRDALLRRAMLAVDMAHIMGGPGEILQRFGRAVESILREGRASVDADQPPADAQLLIPEVLPPAKAPKLDPEHLLERAEGLTRKEFKRRYFNEDKPVALGNVGASWPALRKWRDLRWLKREHGHRNVPLEMGAYDDAANWREEVMPLARFVDEYLVPGLERELAESEAEARAGEEAEVAGDAAATPTRNVAYLAQHQLFEQLPSLLSDFDPPDVCGTAGGVQRVNAWVGTAGTVTPCHFDSYDNLLGQVAGFKFVRLYAASDSPFLYRHAGAWAENRSWPGEEGEGGGGENAEEESRGAGEGAGGGGDRSRRRDAQGNISRVDVEHPDMEKFPLFAKARHMDVILGPGEFIYIPARCWHYVRALTTSVSLNFLF